MLKENSSIGLSLFFGLVSFIALYIAYRYNFFTLRKNKEGSIEIRFWQVFTVFFLYFFSAIFLGPFILRICNLTFSTSVRYISILGFINFLIMFFLFTLYYAIHYKKIEKSISIKTTHLAQDLKISLAAWAIATPCVSFVAQVLESIVKHFTSKKELPEQLSINYLKMALNEPSYLVLSIFSTVILAPIIEEFLFRGFLQTWIKKYLGALPAIIFSSTFFSAFHFSPWQKWGNVVVIGALFPLAFFLGFIYEKQKTLIAPICLHAFFNLSSILSLIFLR